jgi:hypothetical protein
MDGYCDSVEAMIQDRAKKGEGKKHKALRINTLDQAGMTCDSP